MLAAQGAIVDGYLADRYRVPQPRLALGAALHGIAHAAMDVSDGLVQDLGHLCRESGVAAEIEAGWVPLSDAARQVVAAEPGRLALCLTGGDDYELLFAVPPALDAGLIEVARAVGIPVTRIGAFRTGEPRVTVMGMDGAAMGLSRGGWSHFA